jgi:hypothetical protein
MEEEVFQPETTKLLWRLCCPYIYIYILSRFYGVWLYTSVGLVIEFIEHLQNVTTSNCIAIGNSHSAIHYSTHLSLLSVLCLHQSLSGNGFQRGGRSPSSGLPNYPRALATRF